MTFRPRLSVLVPAALIAFGLSLVPGAASAAPIPAPPDVLTALQAFDTAPEAAMVAWTDWAQGQPMTFTTTAVDGKVTCRIDSAGVTKCVMRDPKPDGTGTVYAGTTYISANHKVQVFKRGGNWVSARYGVDANPITNSDRFYPYDYWLPWKTADVPVSTSTDAYGWHVVTAQNLEQGDDQSAVTAVQVSPDGSRAVFLQLDKAGHEQVRTTITLRDVPAIVVPKVGR